MNRFTGVAGLATLMAEWVRLAVLLLAVISGIARAEVDPAAAPPPVAIAYFEDATGALTIEQVAAPEMAGRFAPAREQDFYRSFTDSAIWFRITLPASSAAMVTVVGTRYTDFLDFFRPRNDGRFDATHTGGRRPFITQEFDYRIPAFRMEPSPGGKTHFYLRAASSMPVDIPLRFLGDDEFQRVRLGDNLKLGMYFGLLLGMALYNLFLYFGVRDRAYLWYAAWVGFFGLFQAIHHGLAAQWLWRDAPLIANYAPVPLVALAWSTMALFTSAVLGLRERAPRLDLLAQAVAWSGWLAIAAALIGGMRGAFIMLTLQGTAAAVASAAAAVFVWSQGYRPARYVVIAMSFLWLCSLIATTHGLGLLSEFRSLAYFFSYDGGMIASAIETVLFAFALADRITLLKAEKEQAQAEALSSQVLALAAARRSEHELEQLVLERTQALTRAKDEAQQATLAKTRFLAAASHDLRQPMYAIGLLVGALRERVTGSEAGHLVDKIEGSVEAMDGLFNALLDISKLDSGIVAPNPTAVRLQSLFERLALVFAPQAQSKGLQFRVRKTRALIRTDAVLLDRILSNLVANALCYTDVGGVLIAARVRGRQLRIEVWDTGGGIPADQQAAVFEEFVQLDNPTRDRAKGRGLGLSIVKRAAALLDHPITLHSTPGRGSVLSVTVPFIGQASPLEGMNQPPAPGADLTGAFVVVVDDEPDILEGMRALLGQFGMHVVCATSGPLAVAALAGNLRIPDLIISDYRIAVDHNGVDAIRMIRQSQQADIPALLITGESSSDDLDLIRASGLRVICKPVSADRLRSAMAEAIGHRSHGVAVGIDMATLNTA